MIKELRYGCVFLCKYGLLYARLIANLPWPDEGVACHRQVREIASGLLTDDMLVRYVTALEEKLWPDAVTPLALALAPSTNEKASRATRWEYAVTTLAHVVALSTNDKASRATRWDYAETLLAHVLVFPISN